MPELPEVETTRRGLEPHVQGRTITQLVVRERRLRQRVSPGLTRRLQGQHILGIRRRGKYLLFDFQQTPGKLLIHLGMSGSLRMAQKEDDIRKHDHIDLVLNSGLRLRYHDPRRFGLWTWAPHPYTLHPLLAHLGPEPLSEDFHGEYLFQKSRGRRTAVKNFLMDARIVVGIGNIYAAESLFAAGIRPGRRAARVSRREFQRLATHVRHILQQAISLGGTTLQDFVGGDGKPGYFGQKLWVYGREGLACKRCQAPIRKRVIAQRTSCYCPSCQS